MSHVTRIISHSDAIREAVCVWVDESCHLRRLESDVLLAAIYGVMSRADESCHTLTWYAYLFMYGLMSHVTYTNWSPTCCLFLFMYESRHMCTSHVTCRWAMSHFGVMLEAVDVCVDESCTQNNWSLTCCWWQFMYESYHVRMSHVTCWWVIIHSILTAECDVLLVAAHVWVVSRVYESCHEQISHFTLCSGAPGWWCMSRWVMSCKTTEVWRAARGYLCMRHVACVWVMLHVYMSCHTLKGCSWSLMHVTMSHVT